MNEKFDIVMFSMSPYSEWVRSHKANRNYHILTRLTNDSRIRSILTIDFLPFTFRRAAKLWFQEQMHLHAGRTISRNLTSRLLQVSKKLYVYETVDSVISEKRLLRNIKKAVKILGFKDILLWSYLPYFVKYFGKLSERLSVFDTVDNWAEHPSYAPYAERLRDNYSFLLGHADVIFTVTDHLAQSLFHGAPKVHYVPNGVDTDLFGTPGQEPADLANIPHPRFGYVGVIQQRVDFDMVQFAAINNPTSSFIFVGPIWKDAHIEKVQHLKNVYFLGQKSYEQLPSYIQHFDVGIIPHRIDAFVKSMNPLKLYEYLACGKPVITTPVSGIEQFSEYISVAHSQDQFSNLCSSMLKGDTPELHRMRQEAVKPHSWEKRVEDMLGFIFGAIK